MEMPEVIVPNPHLLQSDHLLKYILETSVHPREPQILKELRDTTAAVDARSPIALDPHSGQLVGMLLKMLNPKRTLEIGITAIDPKAEWYEVGLPFIKKAGVEHKIDFVHSIALPVLDDLLLQGGNEGSFDFAFVDADKNNYGNYHERLMKLVRIGGVIVYDNVLWGGTVASPDGDGVPDHMKEIMAMAIEFNGRIAGDDRVEICVAPVGDGLTICRRIS
ncbi:unnamed protein product [Linum tenue]|uniref:Caffeoyl-CoA O-methyltransferase n=1 Tax=Linum tenue TaxID=586396 RepID=A0AAV0QDR9_9ROSI|nr:unnamed protein product [Linum tenue]